MSNEIDCAAVLQAVNNRLDDINRRLDALNGRWWKVIFGILTIMAAGLASTTAYIWTNVPH